MGFWIFMLLMNLLLPIIMIIFGKLFTKNIPKTINMAFGYRTSMSMKNEDTWTYAHKLFGDIWYKLGIVLLVLSIIASIFTIGKSDDFLGNVTIVNESIQLIVLITPIFYVEKKLKETFDSNGNRK
ncbi:SdpI family protein [Anaerofustis stercorihominis]|uniref:SdpI family protein n=1 Tax=Anaerofustis stercorihominis TaxID=214853 RepID=UPI0026726381|nr:SdpI family protein [Anaerofustis stercorihominis]